jgi:hypothetical protein
MNHRAPSVAAFLCEKYFHDSPNLFALAGGYGSRTGCAQFGSGRVLLLLGAECRHPAAGPKSLHYLGSRKAAGKLYGPTEVRGQRPGLRHGHPDAVAAQAARDAARFLQASRKHLAVYSILMRREFAHSKLMPGHGKGGGKYRLAALSTISDDKGGKRDENGKPTVVVLGTAAGLSRPPCAQR